MWYFPVVQRNATNTIYTANKWVVTPENHYMKKGDKRRTSTTGLKRLSVNRGCFYACNDTLHSKLLGSFVYNVFDDARINHPEEKRRQHSITPR